jgi:hypothetical protein
MTRYYSPALDRGLLDAEQSHHCAKVMRQAVGDLFAIFDGHGTEAKARITEIARDQVAFQILAKATSPRPAHPVWLAQALTKPKSMDLIFQKATELGVSELAPLQSDHSIAQVEDRRGGQAMRAELAAGDSSSARTERFCHGYSARCGEADRVAAARGEAPEDGAARTAARPEAGHAHRGDDRAGRRFHAGGNRPGSLGGIHPGVARKNYFARGNGCFLCPERNRLRADGVGLSLAFQHGSLHLTR